MTASTLKRTLISIAAGLVAVVLAVVVTVFVMQSRSQEDELRAQISRLDAELLSKTVALADCRDRLESVPDLLKALDGAHDELRSAVTEWDSGASKEEVLPKFMAAEAKYRIAIGAAGGSTSC